jgi:acetyl esterase/lipase
VVDRRFPLIIFVQGSAWRKQNLYMQIPALSDMAAHGYVIASVECRDTDQARFPAQLEDVKSAIRFMRANASKYAANPERVGVWGDSSGGHLSLMTGLTCTPHDKNTAVEERDDVLAVVDYYGITDLLTLGDYNVILDHGGSDSPEGLLLGGKVGDRQEEAKKASPVYQDLDRELPPFLIIHGDSDKIVHISQSMEMYHALRQHGKKALFYKVVGADHGVGVWNPEVLHITERFFAAQLRQPDYDRLFTQNQN